MNTSKTQTNTESGKIKIMIFMAVLSLVLHSVMNASTNSHHIPNDIKYRDYYIIATLVLFALGFSSLLYLKKKYERKKQTRK